MPIDSRVLTLSIVVLLQVVSGFAPHLNRHSAATDFIAPMTHTAPTAASPVSVVVSMTDEDKDVQMVEEDESSPVLTDAVKVEPGTHNELMYALGVNLARQLGDIRPLIENRQELTSVAKGLVDAIVGNLDEQAQHVLLTKRGKDLDQVIVSRANALREQLEARGRDMLERMSSTEGVKVLDSGVAVHILEHGPEGEGKGVRPTQGSTVQIHYNGTLPDGTVFDSTMGRDPVKFPLAKVIPGWREGVLAMREGETAMIGIPPEQAYGAEGTPDGRIPGGSTLFFRVQLLDVLTGGLGGEPTLLGANGQQLNKEASGGLLGPDGRPLN